MLWVFVLRYFLVKKNQRFGTTRLSHLQGLEVIQENFIDYLEALRMGQTSSPETLVYYQNMTPRKNPKTYILAKKKIFFHILSHKMLIFITSDVLTTVFCSEVTYLVHGYQHVREKFYKAFSIVFRDSVGSTPTRYELDGPGNESRWGYFPHTSNRPWGPASTLQSG